MRTRVLGRTGLPVSELGLGGLFLAADADTADRSRATIAAALAAGITYIDTAPAYGDSERVIGASLSGHPGPVVLSTKLGAADDPRRAQDPGELRASVERSLRRLRIDQIDILMLHEPDRPAQVPWWRSTVPLDGPVLGVVDQLKTEGKIRFTGLGGTTAYYLAHLCRTGLFDVVLTAFNYSLLWREAERELLPAAAAAGMGVVIGAPFQQGALARRWDREVADGPWWLSAARRAQFIALYRLLDDVGISVREAALRFVISNPVVSSVVVGARSPSEITECADLVEAGPLHPVLLQRLAEVAATVPYRPFDEPPILPFGMPYPGPGAMA